MVYAPPRENGDAPYVVYYNDWATSRVKVVYARDAHSARYEAVGRRRPGVYVTRVRRATPADMTDGAS
jgi:hypothetical protein